MATYRGVIVGALGGSSEWVVESYTSPVSGSWVMVRHRGFRVPDQGWKLHVSSGVARAEETLRRTLPHLLTEPVAFKVAASPDALAALNDGLGAYSQIGKFVTVYPGDDAHAVRLATAVADATADLRGPRIPSDRPLRPGSVVHYRYGSFGSLTLQRPNGELVFALRTPSGEVVPDVRTGVFMSPDWARDPFTHAGVAAELVPERPLVAGRYLVVSPLHVSARGSVLLAVDLDDPRTCVLKQAQGGTVPHLRGGEPGERLHHEVEVLERLSGTAGIPTVAGVVSEGEDLYLVMDDLGGRTLESHVLTLNRRGARLPIDRVIGWGRELARILSSIHAAGLVYRDLKSTNVLVAPDLSLRLVDFELAAPPGGGRQAPGFGTRGYVSPQQAGGDPPDVTDDVFALGAVLFYLLTGAEPSQAPHPLALLDRPLRLLNPGVPVAMEALVARCLAADADARYSTMAELDAALAAVAPSAVATSSRHGPTTPDARRRSLHMAMRIGDTLCRVAEPAPGDRGLRWVSGHPLTSGLVARDVNAGTAGTVLALAELVGELADPDHRAVLAAGAAGLAAAARPSGEPLPGLYVGESGVAAALLRAGQVLGDERLVAAASDRGVAIATMPYASPDLFCGTAGRLRLHLLLWDETGGADQLAAALAAGEELLALAEGSGNGESRWTIPPGYGGTSGRAYLGYAHGAAGIGDALLDLAEVTGDERFSRAAAGAARWLIRLAEPVLDDGSGVNWPATEGEEVAAPHWCHGAAGIGQFLLHAAQVNLVPEAADLARRALTTVGQGARWAPPPQCHGLAGSIEVLLDGYQATGDPALDDCAGQYGSLLEAFASESDGLLLWPSESPLVVSPDYMVGYAGVATAFLRLADPGRRPRTLTRAGFRHGVAEPSRSPGALAGRRDPR